MVVQVLRVEAQVPCEPLKGMLHALIVKLTLMYGPEEGITQLNWYRLVLSGPQNVSMVEGLVDFLVLCGSLPEELLWESQVVFRKRSLKLSLKLVPGQAQNRSSWHCLQCYASH